jgi:glycosyltransferase involved in cell wall biosynthesis
MVSIIIPNYNKSKTIEETLQSICNQVYNDWECIVVDDQSDDDSKQIIETFVKKDKRFSFYTRSNDRLKGPSSCRNIGIEKAIGNYIVFLDSDDLLASYCLDYRINTFLRNQDCDFLVFQMERFKTTPKKRINIPLEVISDENAITKFLELNSLWQVTSPIYKTSFIRFINGFNEDLKSFEDVEVAIKSISFSSKYIIFNTIDSFYRNDENYKIKYSNKLQFDLTINSFELFIHSIHTNVISKVIESKNKNRLKTALLVGYKKIFKSIIVEYVKDYKTQNKSIIDFFSLNSYISSRQRIKFYFVHYILLQFYRVKGIGLYRFINLLYK